MPAELKMGADGFVQLVDGANVLKTMTPAEAASRLGGTGDITGSTVTFKVNGSDRAATVGELMKMAEKAEGADAKFREAADAIKVMDIMKKIQSAPTEVNPADYDWVLAQSGASQQQRTEALAMLSEVNRLAAEQGNQGGGGTDGNEGTTLTMDHMPPEVRQAVQAAGAISQEQHAAKLKSVKAEIENMAREVLTKDSALGIMIANEANGQPVSWDKDGGTASFLFNELMDKVRSRVLLRPEEALTPEVMAGIAQNVRNAVLRLGKVGVTEQAKPTALGPALGLISRLQATGPVERVPFNDPRRKDYIRQALAQA